MKIVLTLLLMIFISITLLSQSYREIYTNTIILNESQDNNNNLYIIKAPDNLVGTLTFTIPVGSGNSGDILTSNGISSTTWTDLNLGEVGGNSNGLIQFNNSGFGASNSFFWDNTNYFLGVDNSSPSFNLHTSGTLSIGSNGNTSIISIYSPNSVDKYLYIKSNNNGNSSVNYMFPSDNGSSNKGLICNSSGSLSWGGEVGTGPVSNNQPDSGNEINSALDAYIGGGTSNVIETGNNDRSTIYGGTLQNIKNNSDNLVLFAGEDNTLDVSGSDNASIVGGKINVVKNYCENSSIFFGQGNEIDKSFYSLILGGITNKINGNDKYYSIVFSGNSNDIQSLYTMVSGKNNKTTGDYSAIFSGESNDISGANSFIGSGKNNNITNLYGAILTGENNSLNNSTDYSAVLYGATNVLETNSNYTFIGGNSINVNPGNGQKFAYDCILLGRRSKIDSDGNGRLIFADANNNDLVADSENEFRSRFTNGYRLYTNTASTIGATIASGASSWAYSSDKNLKEAIVSLNPTEFLNKIKNLEIFSWSYIGFEDKGIRNYGPMAQDFYSLFGEDEYGTYGDDKSIKELDAAAIFILGVQGSDVEVENQTKLIETAIENSKEIDSKLRELEKKLESLEKEIK